MTDRRMTDGLLSLIAELESDRSLLLQDRVRRRIEALDRTLAGVAADLIGIAEVGGSLSKGKSALRQAGGC